MMRRDKAQEARTAGSSEMKGARESQNPRGGASHRQQHTVENSMPTILDRRTDTTSLRPRYVSKGKTKEERERDKWRRLPSVRHSLLALAYDKNHAIMVMDYNKGKGKDMNNER
jgi:hypothetical protein